MRGYDTREYGMSGWYEKVGRGGCILPLGKDQQQCLDQRFRHLAPTGGGQVLRVLAPRELHDGSRRHRDRLLGLCARIVSDDAQVGGLLIHLDVG